MDAIVLQNRSSQNQSDPSAMIQIVSARENTLKNFDLQIPRNELVAITGISGSGKSSLVKQTLVAYAQRQFLESLTTQNRSLMEQFPRPAVDRIEGLPPVIDLSPASRTPHPRSTLGTITEIHDFLSLLFARAGAVHCPQCNQQLEAKTVTQIIAEVLQGSPRQKLILLAPVWNDAHSKVHHPENVSISDKEQSFQNAWKAIANKGFVRARFNGEIIDTSEPLPLEKLAQNSENTLDAVVDRIILKEGIESRLRESIESALQMGDGRCLVLTPNELFSENPDQKEWLETDFQTELYCAKCDVVVPHAEPHSFSFWSTKGCCLSCKGIGKVAVNDTVNDPVDDALQTCPDCNGSRLNQTSSQVKIFDKTLPEISRWSIAQAKDELNKWNASPVTKYVKSPTQREVIERLLPEITNRLHFLDDVGLGYLSLSRSANTLSSGELQRARLASGLGSGLSGVCYILDEPSSGLHRSDCRRLLNILKTLQERGNSVIFIEHHLDMIRACSTIIDLGPSAGQEGGNIVATGSAEYLTTVAQSKTGIALAKKNVTPKAKKQTPQITPIKSPCITLKNATLHNLKNVTLEIPLGKLVAVSGVSGSGKSSLILETLAPAVRAMLNRKPIPDSCRCKSVSGIETVQHVRVIDQKPIGQSVRSNPATYVGIWKEIRNLFAKSRTARIHGYTAKRFSFNAREGQCSACSGTGWLKSETKFFDNVPIDCPVCQGQRFNPQTLAVRYRDHSLADILKMSVAQAIDFFEAIPKIHLPLKMISQLGLGYLVLGQTLASLSSGECQRLKLAVELCRPLGNTLFILDEPTRGLHATEIDSLLSVLRELVGSNSENTSHDSKNTIVYVEHSMKMIESADWVVHMGLEAGESGGTVTACGPPHAVAVF